MSDYATAAPGTSRLRPAAFWTLRGLAALVFLPAAVMKLLGLPMTVAEFDQVGFGQWLRYATAFAELAGGIAVLMPRLSHYGAALLLLVDAGAFFAQVTVLHLDWIHTVVVAAVLGAVIYLQPRPWA